MSAQAQSWLRGDGTFSQTLTRPAAIPTVWLDDQVRTGAVSLVCGLFCGLAMALTVWVR